MRRKVIAVIAALVACLSVATLSTGAHAATPASHSFHITPAFKALSTKLLVAADKEMMHNAAMRHGQHRIGCSNCGSGFSGYAVNWNSSTKATLDVSEFVVPQAHCSQSTYGTSGEDIIFMWAGIDGAPGTAVEQDGLEIVCKPGMTPQYLTWVLICCNGGPGIQYPLNLNVSAGDTITADVCAPGNNCGGTGWFFEVADDTNDKFWTNEQFCPSGDACNQTSAETIMEVGNDGVSTLGVGWDLLKYTWSGTNGNIGEIIDTTNGSGVLDPPPGTNPILGDYNMQDNSGNAMTTLGTIQSDGQSFTWTYDGCC